MSIACVGAGISGIGPIVAGIGGLIVSVGSLIPVGSGSISVFADLDWGLQILFVIGATCQRGRLKGLPEGGGALATQLLIVGRCDPT